VGIQTARIFTREGIWQFEEELGIKTKANKKLDGYVICRKCDDDDNNNNINNCGRGMSSPNFDAQAGYFET
jgi:hypothetical protein